MKSIRIIFKFFWLNYFKTMDFSDMLGDGGFGEFNPEEDQDHQELQMFGLNTQEMEEMRSQKDSVIFLIDFHKGMHQNNPHNGADQKSNVEQVLRAALSFIKAKIISSENDKVGIVLYGSNSSNNSLNLKNVDVMYSISEPDANLVKMLETKIMTYS